MKNFGTNEHLVCHLLSTEPITAVMSEQEEKRQTFPFTEVSRQDSDVAKNKPN